MITVENLTKKYGVNTVVSDISLHLKKGEVLGFIGPNGAGKSTTIKMISGVLPVYAGRICIDGQDIAQSTRSVKNKIGYLPENAPLPPNMTVRAFLLYVASMRGIGIFKRKAALSEVVSLCGLENVLDQEIDSLSKGYKRRVCFAQAIIHKPPVLLLDEPTDGLDPNQKREIRNLIQVLSKDAAIIISTHILEEVQSVCTKVLLLSKGTVVFDGSTETFSKMKEKIACAALYLKEEDMLRAATLMRTRFPGAGRLDGNRLVVPEEMVRSTETMKIFEDAGLHFTKQESYAATLDDVFAFLTRKSGNKDEVSTPAQMPAPSENKEIPDDDD